MHNKGFLFANTIINNNENNTLTYDTTKNKHSSMQQLISELYRLN